MKYQHLDSLETSILMIPAILHQQTTRTADACIVGGAECGVHYFEFAVVQFSSVLTSCSHRASFSSKFKLERSEEAASSSAAIPQLKI